MRLHFVRAIVVAFAALCLTAATTAAQTNYYWNPTTGGAGTWDTTTLKWSTASGGPVNYTWLNNGLEIANFGNTAGTVTLQSGGITAYGLVFSTTGYTISGSTLTLAGTGGVINTGALASETISSVIAGSVGLTRTGTSATGVLTLSGSNTYTGVTTINSGIVSVANLANGGSNSGIGSASNLATNLVLNGGTLRYTGAGASTDRLFTLGAGATGGTLDASGSGAVNFTNAGPIGFTGTGTRTLTLTGTSAAANTLAVAIGDDASGATSLTKAGAGTWVLSGNNTYSGGTTVNAGVLQFNNPGAIAGTGATVTANANGAAAAGYAIDQAFLGRIVNTSAGTVALAVNSSNNLDFSAAGANLTAAQLGASGNVTYSGTLTPNGNTYRLGGGGGTLTMGNPIVDVGGPTNVASGISGVLGTVVFPVDNTYTGTTTINGGVLQFNTPGAIGGTGASVTVNSGGAAAAGYAIDQAFLGRIVNTSAGTVALAVDSSNNLDFSAAGANLTAARLGASTTATYSGTLTPNGNTYRLGGGTGTLTMASPLVDVGGATNLDVGISGVSGVVVLPVAATYTGTTTINGGSLRAGNNNVFANGAHVVNSGGTLDVNGTTQTIARLSGGGTVALGSGTLTLGGDNASTTFSGVFTGSGTWIKTGTGTLTLTANSTWTGPLTVTGGGVVSIDNQTRLNSSATGIITLDNGTIQETNPGSAGTFTPAGRNIVLGPGGGTLEYTTSGVLIIVQTGTVISGSGGLNKTGPGIISVVTPATYTGPTHVIGGTLRVRTNNNVFPTATALTVDSGAVFDLSTLNQQVGSVAGAGSVTIGGGTFTVSGSTSTTFSGIISGTGSVTKAGSSTLTLTGANTYTGVTRINGGVLAVNSLANVATSSSLGAPATANATINIGNTTTAGTLQYVGSSNASTDRVVNLNGTTGGATLDSSGSGTVTFTSNLTATGAGSKTLTLTGTNTAANTIGGAIVDNSSTNKTSVLKTGVGTWVLAGTNTYSGATTVANGTLQVGSAGAIPTGGSAGNVVLSGGAVAGVLDLNGFSPTINGLFGTTGTVVGQVLNNGSGTANLSVGNNDVSSTYAGVIKDNGGTGGLVSLTKIGTGTLLLNGTNTYTGATTVSAGTLGGTGQVGGALGVNSGGTVRAGDANAVGTLTVAGGLTMNSGSNLSVRITSAGSSATAGTGLSSDSLTSPTNHNYLSVTGGTSTFDPGMNVVVDVTGLSFQLEQPYSYKVAQVVGDQSALNITSTATPGQFTFTPGFNYSFASLTGDGSGGIYLNFTPVPEPSTVLAVGAAVLGLGGLLRRRLGRRVIG